jgi:predicted Fe-Mo cluster-binding NifX family protein
MAYTIAIPAAGPTPDAPSSIALGHAPYLLLIDPGAGTFEAYENPAALAAAHPGAVVAKFLLERGITDVLGHHMGPHPVMALSRGGVRVHEGREGLSCRDLLQQFQAGSLAHLAPEEIIARHGPCSHGCGGGHNHAEASHHQ